MKSSVNALAALLVCLVAISVGLSSAQETKHSAREEPSLWLKNWMKRKLEFSQNVLAGLTEGDFDKIRKNAEALNILGNLERWVQAKKPDYVRQVSLFEFANSELIRQARDKNIDGATLAYNQLTVSCVQCHKIVRDVKN